MTMNHKIMKKSDVEELLKSVLEKEQLQDATIQASSGMNKGDGYMSALTKVAVSKDNKKLNLVIKSAPTSAQFRYYTPVRNLYLREIYMYEVMFPAFEKFQSERNLEEPFNSLVKSYKTCSDDLKETLVLDDIRCLGFKMHDRYSTMDENHINFVFTKYAKYHAISYAMKKFDLDLYKTLTKNLDSVISFDDGNEFMKAGMDAAFDAVTKLFSNNTDPEINAAMHRFRETITEFYHFFEKTKNENSVIIHGDCWCNNMMFKYEDDTNPKKPTDMRLIDFQLSTVASPVTDLSYFFYLAASKSSMDNLENHLKVYHNALTQQLEAFGLNAGEILTFENLKTEWKTFGRYGFTTALMIMKAMLTSKDEIVDFSDVTDKGVNAADMFVSSSNKINVCDNRLRDIGRHFYENKFI